MYRMQKPLFIVCIPLMLVAVLTHWLLVIAASPPQTCSVPGDFSTVQAAVNELTCETINVGMGTFFENVTIGRTVIIVGQGAHNTIVDGSASGSVLVIQTSGAVTLTELTIINGLASKGGGIYNNSSSTVTLNNSILSGNSASTFGGGIYNSSGKMTLNNSTLSSNSAGTGGSIWNSGPGMVTLNNSILVSNTASGSSGGIENLNGTVILNNSTLIGNTATNGGFAGGIFNGAGIVILANSTLNGNSAADGGGILNTGTLTFTNSALSGNSASVYGGGIYNSSGTVSLYNSTLNGNSTDNIGGGIWNSNQGVVSLNNSTLNGNSADDGGGIWNNGIVTLTHSTLSGNSASTYGGGIYNNINGNLSLNNSIVANNPTGGDCFGAITSQGYNIDSDDTCNLTATGDITNTDPLLGPLQDNGSNTLTHALLPGSPAIERIPDGVNNCQAGNSTDQRGYIRAGGGAGQGGVACDMGAYEFDTNEPIVGLATSNDSPTILGNSTTLTATIKAGSNVTYLWDFGDSIMGSGAIVSHVYSAAGIYSAVVTATNSISSITTTTTVTVDKTIAVHYPLYLPLLVRP